MGRRILLVVISLLLLSGCVINNIDDKNIDDIVSITIDQKTIRNNVNYKGYSYYLPMEMTKMGNNEYNELLYSNSNDYYIYVDIVSYYNKIGFVYENNTDAYYSDSIENGNKKGYIEINEIDDLFFVEIMYNYSKIETMVEKEYLKEVVANSIIILNSIVYNDIVIDILVGERSEDLKKETYNIFKPKSQEGNFLDYVEEYGNYDEIKDEATIIDEECIEIIE